MTRFICQELLYEFVADRLSPQRHSEMVAYLATCAESQRELERLQKGIHFVAVASRVQISGELQASLEDFKPRWKKVLSAWTMHFSNQGWRLLPYAVGAMAIALSAVVFKPWEVRMRSDVLLVEQTRSEPDMQPGPLPGSATPASSPTVTPPLALVEEQSANARTITLNLVANLMESHEPLFPYRAANLVAVPLAPIEIVTREAVATAAAVSTVPTPTAAEAEAEENERTLSITGKGWLNRADLEVADFDMAWPAIRSKIIALEGKVAGNVELGWLRQETEAYFHFSVPESNRNELEIFLKTFGPVRLSRERHPRVMPDGQIRIILTVRDGNTIEDSPETP